MFNQLTDHSMWMWCVYMRVEWVALWKHLKVWLSCTCWGQGVSVWVNTTSSQVTSHQTRLWSLYLSHLPVQRIFMKEEFYKCQIVFTHKSAWLVWSWCYTCVEYWQRSYFSALYFLFVIQLNLELETKDTWVPQFSTQMLKTTHNGCWC